MSTEPRLNPDIKTIGVGARQLRDVMIYPLSAKDQFELTKKLVDAINKLGDKKFMTSVTTDAAAVEVFEKLITENLSMILEYVCDKDQLPRMEELTNNQISEIVTSIFEVNYEHLIKNCRNLFEKAKVLLPSLLDQKSSRRTK